MLKDTERLVVKGPKGVFTEQGGNSEDSRKLCFPHYSCKNLINDFGFVKDFKIEAVKDRYSFFSAKPMNTILPTYEDIIQVLTTSEELESSSEPSIMNGFIYGNYICINIGGVLSLILLIVTKDEDTGKVVYTCINNPSIMYKAIINNIASSRNFVMDFIQYIIKNSNPSKIDRIRMLMGYKNKQSMIDRSFFSSSQYIKICDNFFVTYIDRPERTTCDCAIYTIICGKIILFDICIGRVDLLGIEILIDNIGTSKLSEILDEMKKDKSFPRMKKDLIDVKKDNIRWPIKDAYEKGYITIISMKNSSPRFFYNQSEFFIRWNALSNYQEYEYYKEMDIIIREEENEINSLMKSLGKIKSTESIKRLKDLNTINTIYKLK